MSQETEHHFHLERRLLSAEPRVIQFRFSDRPDEIYTDYPSLFESRGLPYGTHFVQKGSTPPTPYYPMNEPDDYAPLATIEDIIAQTKQFRRDIDGIVQKLRAAMHTPNPEPAQFEPRTIGRVSRERSIALTKLQEAVMWLGMDLKAIGEENPGFVANPYPSSKDPSVSTIEPTADGLKL